MPTYFTHTEAKSKLGKKVKAKVSFYQIPRGTIGMVTDMYKMGNLYGLEVSWGEFTDGFSKDDYEEFLEEI